MIKRFRRTVSLPPVHAERAGAPGERRRYALEELLRQRDSRSGPAKRHHGDEERHWTQGLPMGREVI